MMTGTLALLRKGCIHAPRHGNREGMPYRSLQACHEAHISTASVTLQPPAHYCAKGVSQHQPSLLTNQVPIPSSHDSIIDDNDTKPVKATVYNNAPGVVSLVAVTPVRPFRSARANNLTTQAHAHEPNKQRSANPICPHRHPLTFAFGTPSTTLTA